MSAVDMLRIDDVRLMLRLVAEIGGMARHATLRSRALLEGVCGVVGARRAIYAVAPKPVARQVPIWDLVLDVYLPPPRPLPHPTRPCRWISAHSIPGMRHADVFEELCRCTAPKGEANVNLLGYGTRADAPESHRASGLRAAVAGNRAFSDSGTGRRNSSDVNGAAFRRRQNVAPKFLHSIAMCRRWEDGPFQRRDLALLDVFTVDVATQAGAKVRSENDPGLSPRLQEVLDLFLEGRSAKQIAYKLRLSAYTVQEYLKELYRRHGVGGRNELYAYFNGSSGQRVG